MLAASAENDDTIACHIRTMKAEMAKKNPNMEVVKYCMEQSFLARRS